MNASKSIAVGFFDTVQAMPPNELDAMLSRDAFDVVDEWLDEHGIATGSPRQIWYRDACFTVLYDLRMASNG